MARVCCGRLFHNRQADIKKISERKQLSPCLRISTLFTIIMCEEIHIGNCIYTIHWVTVLLYITCYFIRTLYIDTFAANPCSLCVYFIPYKVIQFVGKVPTHCVGTIVPTLSHIFLLLISSGVSSKCMLL